MEARAGIQMTALSKDRPVGSISAAHPPSGVAICLKGMVDAARANAVADPMMCAARLILRADT
jgi:hypothetical protein